MKITHRRKSIRASKDIVLDEYQFVGYRDGYGLYRKGSEWVAQDDARKYEPFKITYEQARGFEPIDKHDTGIQKLQKGLGKKLMSSRQIQDAHTEFDNWYDNLSEAEQARVDDIADMEDIPFYDDASSAQLSYLREMFINSATDVSCIDEDGENIEVVDEFDKRWDEHFGEPTTEVFTADEFDKWMQDVINFDIDEPVNCAEDADDSDDIDLETGPQEYTSERTSINVNKVPAVFRLVSNWRPGTINLDYGGGRADTAADYLSQYDATNLVYDPYNRTAEHNKEVIKLVREHGGADTATCSNVLNVIKEPEVRKNVLENIKKLVKPSGAVYITVYEGSGKGDEGPTKSGYQLNRKTADYLEEIQEVFPDAKRKGKLIVAHPTGSANSAINCAADVSMIGEIQDKLEAAVIKFMTGEMIGYTEDEVKDYSVVEVEEYESEWSGPSIKCEVRAELSFNAMMDLIDQLNPIVEKYNRYSYFDMEDAGIATAYIPLDAVESAINCSSIVAVGGDVNEDGDDVYETVEIAVDTDIEVGDGVHILLDFDYDDLSHVPAWLSEIMPNGTLESSYSGGVDLETDVFELCEHIEAAIYAGLPKDTEPGMYHVTGTVELVYQISGVARSNYWGTDDEYGYDEDTAHASVELVDSNVKDLTCEYIREFYEDVDSATNTCNIGANPDMFDLE